MDYEPTDPRYLGNKLDESTVVFSINILPALKKLGKWLLSLKIKKNLSE